MKKSGIRICFSRHCLLGAAVLVSVAASWAMQTSSNGPEKAQEVENLITDLGSEAESTQSAAKKKLILLMEEALPALTKAAKSENPQVVKHARDILRVIGERQADAWLINLAAFAQQGRVDQVVEQSVYHWQSSRKDVAWQQIGHLAHDLIQWEERDFKRTQLKKLLSDGLIVLPPHVDIGGLRLGPVQEVAAGHYVHTKYTVKESLLVRAETILIKQMLGLSIVDPENWTTG